MKYVIYRGKRHQVLETKFIGDTRLYKLASRFSGGSPFSALKTDCRPARQPKWVGIWGAL